MPLQLDGGLEVVLARMEPQGFFQNPDTLIQILLLLHAPVGFGDHRR